VPDASALRQELATELRTLRAMAGVSGRALGERIGTSQGTVWRIEHAQALPTRQQAQAWLDACAANDERMARVLQMLEDAYREAPTWTRTLAGRGHMQSEIAARERASVSVRNFQPTIVPGLLQTAEYARHLVPFVDRTGEVDVEEHVAKRLERQAMLDAEGCRFAFFLGERALRWSPGPGVMAAQLEKLATAIERPGVTLGVVPDAAPVVAWHNFVIHEPADGQPTYVTTETVHGELTVRESADVAIYLKLWDQLLHSAVVGDDAAEWIRKLS
jgi:transcriptional regulator with XRE-family HTH domain